MRSWIRSSLMVGLVATTACIGTRENRRLFARQHAQMGQDMSKEAAELARKETLASLTAQEQARREGDIRLPHHVVREPANPPATEPSTQPVSQRAKDATERGRTTQMERVPIDTAGLELRMVDWRSTGELTCALP